VSSEDGTLRLGPSGSEAKVICVFVHGRGQSPGEMQSHVVARLSEQGVTPTGSTPEDFRKLISTEIRQWTEVAREAHIQAE